MLYNLDFVNVLLLSPYLIVLIQLLKFYFTMQYRFLFKEKSILLGRKDNISDFFIQRYLRDLIITILVLKFFILDQTLNHFSGNYHLNSLEFLFLFFYLLILLTLRLNYYWLLFSYIYVFNLILFLKIQDIVNFYFLLEINFYIFLTLLIVQNFFVKKKLKTVVNTIINLFIINFFTSIILMMSVIYILYKYGDFIMLFFDDNYVSIVFISALLLKISGGP